ncbi:MAG: family 4 glycosyl hydrolase, partial [Planctomycetota bacterium]
QPVGDTLGPGGVFRALRSIPQYQKVADATHKVAPDALLINYANPMAMNCMAMNRMGIEAVGLCHSVQGTSRLLARELDVPYEELTFKVAGYNHQAWFTELRHKGEDVYPRLREVMQTKYASPAAASRGYVRSEVSDVDRDAGHGEHYHQEKVRTEIMRTFGYFHTESSHHGSEYVPWFRKSKEMVDAYIEKRWDYYQICLNHDFAAQAKSVEEKLAREPLTPSHEYGAGIIHSMETDAKRVIYGTVPNWGPPGSEPELLSSLLIPNLPKGAAVEIACLVDRNGIQPVAHGPLPPQCAAVNRLGINVHELTVEAAMTGDRDLVYMAVDVRGREAVAAAVRAVNPWNSAAFPPSSRRSMRLSDEGAHTQREPQGPVTVVFGCQPPLAPSGMGWPAGLPASDRHPSRAVLSSRRVGRTLPEALRTGRLRRPSPCGHPDGPRVPCRGLRPY